MGLFNFSRKPPFQNKTLGFEPNKIKVGRYSRAEHEPVVGEYVKIWNKPDTDEINFYAKGSDDGQGLLGWITSKEISNHLRRSGLYDATITSCDASYFYVQLRLKNECKTPEVYRKEQLENWKKQLQKPYRPKMDWSIRFIMKEGFTKRKKVVLKYKSIEEVLSHNDVMMDAIWIEGVEGGILSESNYSQTKDIIKTLRAIYSGLEVQIKTITKTYDFYDFTIGIAKSDIK